jgi:hypothetical protein
MAKVRRLDACFHIEDARIRAKFDIEDAPEKLNGIRALSEPPHLEHRAATKRVAHPG